MKSVYVCYFGLREPLVQTQVIPYLRGLARNGVEMFLVTFEPGGIASWSPGEISAAREKLEADGIRWSHLRYRRRPVLVAKLIDVASGAGYLTRLIRRERIDVIHARSHVAAMMGRVAKMFAGGRLIFDIRGLLADEYADAGHWERGGVLFRLTRSAERGLLRRADAFVVLTERVKAMLFSPGESRPLEVIPCCIDRDRFRAVEGRTREELREGRGIPSGRFVIAYAGALGGWYLTDEMVDFLRIAREADPSVYALFLTQSPAARLESALRDAGFGPHDMTVRRVNPADVPGWLGAANAGLSFIRMCESKRASSPTKVAEYLACGLPVISTRGIGDVDAVLDSNRVGVIVESVDAGTLGRAFRAMKELSADQDLEARCRTTAWREFDLETIGIARYLKLYRTVVRPAD